jgi:hypothetical protein
MSRLATVLIAILSAIAGAGVRSYIGNFPIQVTPNSISVPSKPNQVAQPCLNVQSTSSSITAPSSPGSAKKSEAAASSFNDTDPRFTTDDAVEARVTFLTDLVSVEPELLPRLRRYYREEGEKLEKLTKAAVDKNFEAVNQLRSAPYTETLEEILGTERYQEFKEAEQKQHADEESDAFLTQALHLQRKVGLPSDLEPVIVEALKEGQYEYFGRGFSVREDATESEREEARREKIIEALRPYLKSDEQLNELVLYLATMGQKFRLSLPMIIKPPHQDRKE